jgi:hypothetical protein
MANFISLREAGVYFGPDGPLSKKLKAGAVKGLLSAALRAQQDIIARVIPSMAPHMPVDRGTYKAGWQVEKMPYGAALYNAVPHAAYIEYGVGATKVVPSYKAHKNIAEWAQRKLGGLDAKKAWEVAGAILWSLRRTGIFNRGRGLRILENYSRRTLPGVIKSEVEKELTKVISQ